MKKALLIVVSLLTVVALVGCNNTTNNNQGNNQNNNNIVNNGQEQEKELPTTIIKGEEEFEQLTFSNIKIVEYEAERNMLVATVTNNGTEDFMGDILDIELFDENNESIGIVGAKCGGIKASESITIEVPIAAGVMNTNNISIKYAGD